VTEFVESCLNVESTGSFNKEVSWKTLAEMGCNNLLNKNTMGYALTRCGWLRSCNIGGFCEYVNEILSSIKCVGNF
jgi:hypothetical protein